MGSDEVKLYGGLRSPYSRRVQIALKLKGIPYTFILEDIQNKSPELLKYNPVHKKIPVLVHNGKPIVESRVILEYIDETWPDSYPLLTGVPYDRAMARFWANFFDNKCMPSIWKAFFEVEPEEQKKASEEALENLRSLENVLAEGKKFFGGERVGYVDIVASWIACWIGPIQETTGKNDLFTEEKYPCLSTWVDNFLSCDIITVNVPQRDSLVAFLNAYIETANISR